MDTDPYCRPTFLKVEVTVADRNNLPSAPLIQQFQLQGIKKPNMSSVIDLFFEPPPTSAEKASK